MPIPVTNSADYYADETLHGNYQFITLEDAVNNYIMSGQGDDFTSNVSRHQVLFQARRAFRELYYDIAQEIKGIALEVSSQLTITLPPDFVNYVRISWLGDDGLLRPLASNNHMDMSNHYLQSNTYEILFDEEGCPLVASEGTLKTAGVDGNSEYASSFTFAPTVPFNPNKNYANRYGNGSYNIDKNAGLIRFSSDIQTKIIVLEYISDGLYTGCEGRVEADLKIHKFAEDSIYNWIYWKLIERRVNVPANAKMLARKEWFNSRRNFKRRMQTIRPDELRQVFKGSNRWIKGI